MIGNPPSLSLPALLAESKRDGRQGSGKAGNEQRAMSNRSNIYSLGG
jgi:hypothetical protein